MATDARADLKLDGRWKQSALREDYTIQQWLESGCGPPPQSASSGGGEIVSIRLEGDELNFVGGGRVYKTNQCYDPMPTLSRESHSRDANGKTWRTRCTTAPSDPRKAFLNTLVVVTTDTRIDIVETGRYDITLESGRCLADVKRTRSFDLVPDESAPATAVPAPVPAPTPVPAPKPTAACGTPGEPSRLEVRPSKKLLRTGETFQFRSVVVDAKGCDTHTATTWKLAPDAEGKGVTVDGTGKVTIAKDAQESSVEIVATAAGKDARVAVDVASPAHYDDLLTRSGLNAAGENDDAATATIASQSIGAGEGRVEDRARVRRYVFMGIIGGVLALLGVIAVVLSRRSKRAKVLVEKANARHERRVAQALDRRRHREAQHAEQMRAHVESVEAARAASASPQRSAAKQTRQAEAPPSLVCTTCGRDFPSPTAFCPYDGNPLAPASTAPGHLAAVPHPAQSPRSRGKICPTCGERFEGGADFCGKDGTQLVLLN